MDRLLVEDIKTDRAGLRPAGPDAMADRFLGVFWQQGLELGLGSIVLEIGSARGPKDSGEFQPSC
jgi:hypothetical protein